MLALHGVGGESALGALDHVGHILYHDTQGVRSASHFWSDGSATNLPIKEFSPTIVFDAAFEGGQSVGPASDRQSLSLLIQKMEPAPCAGPSRANAQTALNSCCS